MEQITHLSSGIPGVRLIDAEHNRFSFPRHFHLEYHIGLLLQGRHRYAAGGERRLAGAGDALLMAPESIHDGSSAGEEGYRIRVLALDADWLERASRDFSDGRRGAPRLTSSLVRDERLQQRLRQLHLGMLGGAAALENRLALEEHLWQALACLLSLGSSLRLEEGDREGFGQHADLRGGGVEAWQAQGAAAVLFLGIDDQQGALPKGGWRVAASADLQKGERMRHVTTPEKAHAFHSGPYRRACEPLPHAH